MPQTLQTRIDGNQTVRRIFGTMTGVRVARIATNLAALSLGQQEAILFRLSPDWTSGAAGTIATDVYDLIEAFRNGGAAITALELHTLVITHGAALGPAAADIVARLDSLRRLLMPAAGPISGANLINLVNLMSAAGGRDLVTTVTTLRNAGMGVAPTPTAVYNCIVGMRTAVGTCPATDARTAAAFVYRLRTLDGGDLVDTINGLGGAACGPLHTAYAVAPMEYLSWRTLGRRVGANQWTAEEVNDTLGALRTAGADTVDRLSGVIDHLTAPTAAGARLSAVRIEVLAQAVNDYAQLYWAAQGNDGGTRFGHLYEDLRTANNSAADIATAIDSAYTTGRAEGLTTNQFTQILNIGNTRNQPIIGMRRFVEWVASAHNEDNAITWAGSIARIGDFHTDHQAGLPALPAAIREHVNADRLNVRDEDLKHYIYGHTYAWCVFSRVNLRRSVNGYLSFWPQGTTIANVQASALARIQDAGVQALMGGLAIGNGQAATVNNYRVTVHRRANHQYDLTQLYPTAAVANQREIHWRVIAGVGMLLGYMQEEAVWAAL